jgi:uncharacterized repeat protein (TIGR03803 family)
VLRPLPFLITLMLTVGGASGMAHASKEKVLYSFTGGDDGANPQSSLLIDASGSLYGTAFSGGIHNNGVLFKLTRDGTETVLHSFGLPEGRFPAAGVIADQNGTLYGTTGKGGTNDAGVVYKLSPDGSETIIHSFGAAGDGSAPVADLAWDAGGNLYGTTYGGGANDYGTIFKITPANTETVVYSFTGGNDGGQPVAGLIMDKKGNLYGTTHSEAEGYGSAFKLTTGGAFKVLHVFSGGDDGGGSSGSLLLQKGDLFGTTVGGGAFGSGTVFSLHKHVEAVLHSFSDGGPPAGLIADKSGNLFGTTPSTVDSGGSVFKLSPDGTYTTLYTFTGGADGASPLGRLTMDKHGNLYGTTQGGGLYDSGTVFKISN